MLNEVLRLTQGDLANVTDNIPISRSGENGEDEERERNSEAFYKDSTGEAHV